MTHLTFCDRRSLETIKLNEHGKAETYWWVGGGYKSRQQTQHGKLRSDLPQAEKERTFDNPQGSHQGGLSVASAVRHCGNVFSDDISDDVEYEDLFFNCRLYCPKWDFFPMGNFGSLFPMKASCVMLLRFQQI